MKRVLVSLLVVILVLGALGAVGFAGYQYGYQRAMVASPNGNAPANPWGMGPRGIQPRNFEFGHRFDRGMDRGFGPMGRGMGFGFFGPLMFLARLAFWGLVIWAIYMLVTRSGWRLTRTIPANPVAPAETYTKVEHTETTTSSTEPETKD